MSPRCRARAARAHLAALVALALLAPAPAPSAWAAAAPPMPAGHARIHYHRPDGRYDGFGLHAWEGTTLTVSWTAPLPPTGRDDFGAWWDVPLASGATRLGLIVHAGELKDPGPDQFADLTVSREWWIVSGRLALASERPDVSALAHGDLSRRRAHWLDRRTIAWDAPPGRVRLHGSATASLRVSADGVEGGATIELERVAEGLAPALRERFPHLAALPAFRIAEADLARVEELLRGQIAASWRGGDGRADATGVQIAGVLDDLHATDAPLGITFRAGAPTLSVWAPTAQRVRLLLFDGPRSERPLETVAMRREGGVWTVAGAASWTGRYYLYEVTVFHPATGRIETLTATDPYSRGLARDGARSWIVDLDDPALAPPGWSAVAKPPLAAFEDAVVYELHVRDFSASDASVPAARRGTFLAFADTSAGTRHLRALADAGITHVHLLPAFDFATVSEDRSAWRSPGDLSRFAPDSEEQQAAIERVRGADGFNWGYDPHHYGVPEGSYATDPDGGARIVEFRRMVQALAGLGLRVVMDVVYNHTHASGVDARAVLDRIVPGYYHRLNADGAVETSTCCANTASEHAMMERLMVDDLVHWARNYRVDGFRFDLMGHHMRRNLERARDRLRALTIAGDGVDGRAILLYGEGWDFGEVQGGRRGVNATQRAMAGTGVATFNDRLRDAARGGSPFSDRREQGFATGRFTFPSAYEGADASDRAQALEQADRIRIGLAGNLAGFRFTARDGREVRGADVGGAGYTADPEECVNYVEAHDNETLWDKIQYAAPEAATLEQRARMQTLALALPALAQGIPFFHAGGEILRTKSLDADSYDSGDWFNRVDWTYAGNHWGMGLPPAGKNRERWPVIGPRIARADLAPDRATIEAAFARFRALLAVRASSPLFRLRDAADVQARVSFPHAGPAQPPGLVAMLISDAASGRPDLDPRWERILVVWNASPEPRELRGPAFATLPWRLHPALERGGDPLVRTARIEPEAARLVVPGLTVAVFVSE